MHSWLWWLKNIFIALFSLLFLLFGINALMAAYSVNNPYEFIMYFFSSSLIILISIVGMIYPAFRIRAAIKLHKMAENGK
jgi:ABC-type antimicrobial peptide transport system permease subunit